MTFLTRTSLKNRLIVGLTTLAVAVVGLFSMSALKQELMPTMQVPMAFVSVQSQGLAPEEMARTITEPVEQALQAVPGVTKVSSTTSSGSAEIMVEWSFGENDDETFRAVQGAADALKAGFPTGTEVAAFSGGSDSMPAMMLSAGSEQGEDGAAFGESIAGTVVPALQGVPGVRKAELAGQEQQRIMIDLRPADVAALKVDPAMLDAVLQAHGAALPAGAAESENGQTSVTVGVPLGAEGTAETAIAEIGALPIATADAEGNPVIVTVSQFADVHLETKPATNISRVNGKPALTLQIMPEQGANVVDISHAVNAELDRLSPIVHAEFVTIFDQAPYIEQSIHDLSVEGGLGLLFAVLVILAFLWSWRSTIIAAMSIPLSLLITLIGLWWSGNTLNILTLGALTIAIGRVVDDSIVVIENISRRRGDGPLTVEGVVASVRQVAGAITASTLTTVAVFLPIAFVSGIAGQLFRPFAVTVSIALLASLFVALTIVPVLAYWFMNRRAKRGGPGAVRAPGADPDPHDDLAEIHTAPDRLQRTIMPALNATRRHPVITLAGSVLVLFGTIAMSSLIPTDFLGSSGAESLQVMQTPTKEQSKDLVKAAEPVEQVLAKVDGVSDVITSIPVGGSGIAGEDPTVSYDVQLDDGADATVVSDAVGDALDRVKDAGEVKLLTQDAFVAGAAGSGIALQIRGNDPAALRLASEKLEQELADARGVQSVESDIKGDQPVVRVKLDEVLAAKLGFDRATVAKAVQDALEGRHAGRLMLEGNERDIVVRTPGAERTAEKIGEIMLPVTPQQTAEAQKVANDALREKAEAQAEEARIKGENELAKQIGEAANARAEMAAQLDQLNAQLAALIAAPVVTAPPAPPGPQPSPEEEAAAAAEAERQAQIAALQEAIAGVRSGIEGADEQIAAMRESQAEAAQQMAEQEAAEAEQKAAAQITGTAIPVSAIAAVEEETTAPVIMRTDGERQVTLTVTPKSGQLDAASAAIDRAIAETDLPAGVVFDLGGVSAEQDEAFAQLGFAMLAAIMLVLLVMVATFRSFRGPFVLLVSIPFAATGAILGLLITGTPLGLPALIGLLMLIGIVVTNAIVLMDLVNRLRTAGASLDEAVEHGTRLRLRPILMTAAATIFALIPMSLGLTGGGVFISKPLAIVVIGGLVSSTLLTLVLVPILYTLVERRRENVRLKRARRRALKIVWTRRFAPGQPAALAAAAENDRAVTEVLDDLGDGSASDDGPGARPGGPIRGA